MQNLGGKQSALWAIGKWSIVQSVLAVIVSSVFPDWLTSLLLFRSLYICNTTRMVWVDQ